jgi:energy-converting hydrogenase B subunit D
VIAGLALFDLLLATTLVWIAWHLLATPERFEAIVLFITFGMLMAVSWTRLGAPDLALVEAAIGAGLTGALLLDTLGRIETEEETSASAADDEETTSSS